MTQQPPARVALVGCGALGSIIARGIVAGRAGNYRLVATLIRNPTSHAAAFMRESNVPVCVTLEALFEEQPQFVVEAASADALKAIAVPALRANCDLVVLSSGAFADDTFLETAIAAATEAGRRIHVAGGAIGALDLVQAAIMSGDVVAKITTEKPPHAIGRRGTSEHGAPGATNASDTFAGSVKEAIRQFPKNVNVAVTLSLALGGFDRATVAVRSNPALTQNRHCIELEGAFGRARVEVEAAPALDNPKSSALAAYSVLSLLKRLASPLQI